MIKLIILLVVSIVVFAPLAVVEFYIRHLLKKEQPVTGQAIDELRQGVSLFSRDVSTKNGDYRVVLLPLQRPPANRDKIKVAHFNLFRVSIKPAKERFYYRRMLTVQEEGSEHLFYKMVREFEERHSEGKNKAFPLWEIEIDD